MAPKDINTRKVDSNADNDIENDIEGNLFDIENDYSSV